MVRRRSISRKEARRIARERMEILFDLANAVFNSDRALSKRYVTLARKIGMRHNVRLSDKEKLTICKKCNSLLLPGVNSRVRTNDMRLVVTCLECGSIRRIPFLRERKDKLNK